MSLNLIASTIELIWLDYSWLWVAFTIPSNWNMLWHKWLENSYDLKAQMVKNRNVPSCDLFKIKKSFGRLGRRRRGGEVVIGCLLLLNLLLTFFFLSTLSAQGTRFTLSTSPKFWIHNMPEGHQNCLAPFSKYPETIIQMFATYMELKAAPKSWGS